MLAEEENRARGATGWSAQTGGVAFATTRWSVIREAQGPSPAAQAALEKLCQTYWRPIYAFVRRQGHGAAEAQDLTQGFFALLLERRDFDAVRQEKGRLRSYLLTSLKHFLANERERARAIKRGGDQPLLTLDAIGESGWIAYESAATWSAEQIFEHRWALSVLEQVLARLRDEYVASGKRHLFDRLSNLCDEPGSWSQAEIAAELGMTANAVKQALHRFRLRYRQLLYVEISQTVTTPSDVEDELRHLIGVLRA